MGVNWKKKTSGKRPCMKAGTVTFAAAFVLVASVPFIIVASDVLDWKTHVPLKSTDFLVAADGRISQPADHVGDAGNGQLVSQIHSVSEMPPPHVPKDFFYLNCPRTAKLPLGEYTISLVYHVDVMNNWEDILRDQMHSLLSCGLGNNAVSFDVLVSPGGVEERALVAAVLKEYEKFIVAPNIYSIATEEKGEKARDGITSDRLEETCRRQAALSGGNETIIFHFRNTGALTYHSDWRQHKSITDEGPYSRSLYWRKYAEWFTIERPHLCIKKIINGAWTCGISAKTNGSVLTYTPGDMWAASCNHLLETAVQHNHVAAYDGALTIGLGSKSALDRLHHAELHNSKKDPNKFLIYPEEYDNTASRFRLMCPNDPFPEGRYNVAMGYHVGMLNNWKEVVSDQLRTVSTCGLGQKASTFLISYSKGDPDELLKLVSEYNIVAKPSLMNATKSPYECPMNTALRNFCLNVTEPTVVFYFHNKGVSKFEPGWRSKMDKRRTYGKSLYWRKLIEFFLIERPSLCTRKILLGAKTCGLGIRGKHQSGNMWVSSCEYLAKQPPCDGDNYIDSEHWLQKGMGKDSPKELPDTYVQMWNPPKVEGSAKNQLLNLYDHLALPEEYANESYLDRSMLRSMEDQ